MNGATEEVFIVPFLAARPSPWLQVTLPRDERLGTPTVLA